MRIVVAMSGGVDSSTVAGLLAEAGHEVIGVTLQLYDHGAATGRKGACCAGQDIHDARRVADQLGIPALRDRRAGPFPRRRDRRFRRQLRRRRNPGALRALQPEREVHRSAGPGRAISAPSALATGHYVRRVDGPDGAELHRAADPARDQSWFLFATTQAQLDSQPVPARRHDDKAAVRAQAERLGLAGRRPSRTARISASCPPAATPTWWPSCARTPPAPGEIVTLDGSVVGRHDGIARYTVGQAKRLGAASSAGGERRWWWGSTRARRRVIVGPPQHRLPPGAPARRELAHPAPAPALHGEAARPRNAACRRRHPDRGWRGSVAG